MTNEKQKKTSKEYRNNYDEIFKTKLKQYQPLREDIENDSAGLRNIPESQDSMVRGDFGEGNKWFQDLDIAWRTTRIP